MTHVPAMQLAGDKHPGPAVALQLPKSAAGATHVVDGLAGVGQVPPAEHVVSASLMVPHGAPAAARTRGVQERVVGLQ
jgi:hypothetical protein